MDPKRCPTEHEGRKPIKWLTRGRCACCKQRAGEGGASVEEAHRRHHEARRRHDAIMLESRPATYGNEMVDGVPNVRMACFGCCEYVCTMCWQAGAWDCVNRCAHGFGLAGRKVNIGDVIHVT